MRALRSRFGCTDRIVPLAPWGPLSLFPALITLIGLVSLVMALGRGALL